MVMKPRKACFIVFSAAFKSFIPQKYGFIA